MKSAGGSSELLLGDLARPQRLPAAAVAAQPPRTCRQRLWTYATWALSAALLAAGSALLFLVPLYVDPAISTLAADFNPFPVTCVTSRRDDLSGLFNCTWSSCREGCTSDMYTCTHLYVDYQRPETEYRGNNATEAAAAMASGPIVRVRGAVLLANIKGCGYPPEVECDNFTTSYGSLGTSFPCYYSRANGSQVMTSYGRERHVSIITHYLAVPLVVTLAASLMLCAMHCDCSGAGSVGRLARSRATVHDFSECQSASSRMGMLPRAH